MALPGGFILNIFVILVCTCQELNQCLNIIFPHRLSMQSAQMTKDRESKTEVTHGSGKAKIKTNFNCIWPLNGQWFCGAFLLNLNTLSAFLQQASFTHSYKHF